MRLWEWADHCYLYGVGVALETGCGGGLAPFTYIV